MFLGKKSIDVKPANARFKPLTVCCPGFNTVFYQNKKRGKTSWVICSKRGTSPDGQKSLHRTHCLGELSLRNLSFPVVERHAAIWIWPGDPTLANDALIPDFSFFEQAPRLEDPTRAGRLRHLYDSRTGRRAGTSRHVLDRRRESPKRPVHTLLFLCQERTPGARSLRIFYESSSARCRYGTVISRTC